MAAIPTTVANNNKAIAAEERMSFLLFLKSENLDMKSLIGAIIFNNVVVCEEIEDGGIGFILLSFEMKNYRMCLKVFIFVFLKCFTCLAVCINYLSGTFSNFLRPTFVSYVYKISNSLL